MDAEVELDCLANDFTSCAMTRDAQQVNLAQKCCVEPKRQHFRLIHGASDFDVSHFKNPTFCANLGEVLLLSVEKLTGLYLLRRVSNLTGEC